MKVRQLIDLLQKIENKDDTVEVAIRQYNKVYPIHYGVISEPSPRLQSNGSSHRIVVHLPDNMYTICRVTVQHGGA